MMNTRRIFFLGLIMLSTSGLFAQIVEERNNFNKVLSGLSEVNVREIVGVPARVEPFVTINNSTGDTSTYWVYNNLYTIVFRNHFVDYVERDRSLFLAKVQQWASPQNKDGIRIKYGR